MEILKDNHLLDHRKPELDNTISDKQLQTSLDDVISEHIRRVLENCRGKISGPDGAAEILQVNPSTLRKRMKKLGIPFGQKNN
jgi:DNA-binding NtrC family response regulator